MEQEMQVDTVRFEELSDDDIVKAKNDLDIHIQFLRAQMQQYQNEQDRRAAEFAKQRLLRAAAEQGVTLDVEDIPSEAEAHL